MELAAAQQALRDVGGLKRRALGRRMGGKVARDGDQDVPALLGVAPLAELPHARLEHLVGVEARILAEQRLRERRDERFGGWPSMRWRATNRPAASTCRWRSNASSKAARISSIVRRKVVEPIAVFARQPRRRHVEVAGEVDRHRAMKHPARRLDRAVPLAVVRPDPLQRLVDGVGVGEDVMGRFPVGMLVRGAETRHAQRRRIGERAAEIGGRRPRPDRRLERLQDRSCIIAEERGGELRMIRPAVGAARRS